MVRMGSNTNMPVHVALAGIGGYGARHLSVLRTLQEFGWCRLMAVADPFAARHPATVEALKADGVLIGNDLTCLLERTEVEAIFLATPLPLHAAQTIAALNADKHVYLEKPPCVHMDDYHRMASAQKKSKKLCAVGFQWQTSPALRFLKRELIRGAIGTLETVWMANLARRNDAYYGRSPWAGRLASDGSDVFDGPATNARAHMVHAALFLAGEGENEWAQLAKVRGVWKRARPLESYDTAFLEAQTKIGTRVALAFTHATTGDNAMVLHCRGTGGYASVNWEGEVTIQPHHGPVQTLRMENEGSVAAVMDFLRAVRSAESEPQVQPASTLENCMPFVQLLSSARASSGITDFAPELVSVAEAGTPEACYQVAGLNEELLEFEREPSVLPSLLPADETEWVQIQ